MFKHMQPEAFQSHPCAATVRVGHTTINDDQPFKIDYIRLWDAFQQQACKMVNIDARVDADGSIFGAATVKFLAPYRSQSAMRRKKLMERIGRELAKYSMVLLPDAEA